MGYCVPSSTSVTVTSRPGTTSLRAVPEHVRSTDGARSQSGSLAGPGPVPDSDENVSSVYLDTAGPVDAVPQSLASRPPLMNM